jgi:formylmethanofuran dehydrogenase subunit E
MENDFGIRCDKCHSLVNDDDGYTTIDGMDLCDDCFEDYQSENARKSTTR